MEVSQLGLVIFCVAAIIEGIILGIAYDAFYVITCVGGKFSESSFQKKLQSINLPLIGQSVLFKEKQSQPIQTIFLFVYDLVFMLCVGISVSVLVYRFNDGQWRFAIVALLLVGYVLYRKLLRRGVLAFVEILEFLIKCVFAYILYFTVRPLKKIVCMLCRSISGGIGKASDRLIERKIQKYSKNKKSEILRNAEIYGTVRKNKKGG